MRLVLLSGGSGKRLWPLSNNARSKQFLKLLKNPQGKMESMVQRVWSQLSSVGLADKALVATNNAQVDILRSQLGSEVKLIVEPERRDTFPAIALAASYLHTVERMNLAEVVVVLPVDPYVEESFFERLKELEQVFIYPEVDLALIGVYPTYPSQKYGYIVPEPDHEDKTYLNVSRFQEKPNEEQAQELMAQNALWNCGVFAFRLRF
ncbi:MAG: sugar phosphate nucleotidyltransferase, partial [Desulfitobacteriaceae bacterium]